MTEPLLTRRVLVRAAARALAGAAAGGLLGAGHGGLGALVLALHGAAAWGATALVERAVATRAAVQARSALVTGLAAAVGCGLVHAAAVLDAALWLQAPGLDLGGRLVSIEAWLDDARAGPGAVFYLVCLAWLLAGASGPAAVAALRRLQCRPLMVPLEPAAERWVAPLEAWCAAFALWVAPVMTIHMDGVGPSFADRVVPFGAVVFVSGMAALMAGALLFAALWGLDLLAAQLGGGLAGQDPGGHPGPS